MATDEKQLAQAIMRGDSRIELDITLLKGVEKIKAPSSVVWEAIFAAIVASAFFWGSPVGVIGGIAIGLPAILAICGGVGGIVFVTLGSDGVLCAYRMLIAVKTADVLTKLRDDYDLDTTLDNDSYVESAVLVRKK